MSRIAALAICAAAPHVCAAAEPIDFARDIQPIFKTRCLGCHNGIKRAGGLRLIERDDVLSAADSGLHPVVPGEPDKSELLRRVAADDASERMPADGESLSQGEIEAVRRWIAEGAAWPAHWAFHPVERPAVPDHPPGTWPRNPLDGFVRTRLRAAGIEPSPAAGRPTLIRRLHLDLVGLPPALEDIDEFVSDPSPHASEKVVDRLLASPRFGERWGRHWLDLARYADTDGYEVDGPRPHAWYFRDWVIRAINEDMPYDRFTIEQLAGDLLPAATAEQHLATAFHRQTLTNKEGGADQEEYRVEAVIDRVNTTATVWLGLTTACAQCHDHPYEPISQRDFYGLFAFFNNADESTFRLTSDQEDDYQRRKAEHEQDLAGLRRRLEDAGGEERARLERELKQREKRAPRDPAVPLDVMARRPAPRTTHVFDRGNFLAPIRDAVVQPGGIGVLHELRPRRGGVSVEGSASAAHGDRAEPAAAADRLDLAKWLVDPRNPLTPRVAVNHVWQHLFGRGLVRAPENLGLNGEPPTHPDLLDWLAAELVEGGWWRVAGRELERTNIEHSLNIEHRITTDHGPRTTDNHSPFGTHCSPTPGAWSRKRLIRLIVTSATYRQSSRHRTELAEFDPRNELLHRQNRFRVEAEIVNDLHLAASGLLAERVGGPSVFPPFPAELAKIDFRSDLKWPTSTGADRYRRGMYTFFKRTLPHPNLTTFDCPQAESTAVERSRSNTPLHALLTLNNEVFVEAARALASRVLRHAELRDDHERMTLAFRLALARPPAEWERSRLLGLLQEHREWYAGRPDEARKLAGDEIPEECDLAEAAAWTATISIVLNLDEFITRE